MTRPRLLLLTLITFATTLGAADCTTDQPKGDGGSAALVSNTAPAADAGDAAVASASDAGSATAAPSDAGVSDSGSSSDAGTKVTTTDTNVKPPEPNTGGAEASVYDRILAKPKEQPFDVEALKALVEKKTGQKVAKARKSAGRWILFQFAPASKARGADDQAKLIAELKGMPEFTVVEGDTLMKVKQP